MHVGIIGAMDSEVALLCEHLEQVEVTRCAGLEFHRGTLAGVDVTVVRSGVGKVNAALCTQALIDHFAPDGIINTGCAGSLEAALGIGDVVVSRDLVQHDFDATAWGYAAGEIPQVHMTYFEADRGLVATALKAADALGFAAREGRIASGDEFVAAEATKARIREAFGADCCEMEGAAIAQVCWANDVPFVVLRTISDNADGRELADFETFAATRAAQLTKRMIEALSA